MNDLAWGLQMTVLGMGLVFGLLGLLWGLLTLAQRLDRAPAPVASPRPSVPAPTDGATAAAETAAAVTTDTAAREPDPELVAAILVATLTHRAISRREAAPAMRSYWPGSLLYASRWVGAGRSRQNHSWQRRSR